MLHSDYYFSFESIPFASLFDNRSVFEALQNLGVYIRSRLPGRRESAFGPHVHLENPDLISIGRGTVIEPGVFIKGPVLIGNNCTLGHGCYIRENVILGDGAVVGHGSEIKNSILFPGAKASHLNYVGDSVLGSNTNLGAGVKCANVRLDGREIFVGPSGKKHPTGLKKMGLILGDGSQIGCNGVTNPGTLIGKRVLCPPCGVWKGFLPSDSVLPDGRGEEG